MTRNEFLEDVNEWSDLIDFAYDIECDICDDIVQGEDLSSRIAEDFSDYSHEYDWTDIRRWINDIQDGHDYYSREGSFEYSVLDEDDFERYKSDVVNYADRFDCWDEEDEEYDDEYSDDEEDEDEIDDEEFEVPDEEFSVSDLFGFCTKKLAEVAQEEEAERIAEDKAFEAFCCSC